MAAGQRAGAARAWAMNGAEDYFVRLAGPRDLSALAEIRTLAGPGFTSLAVGDEVFVQRLEAVSRAAAAAVSAPGEERYILALEHGPSGKVVGMAQVKALVGVSQPFFNFRILQIAAASHSAKRRYDMDVLILVNECTGCTEVGSLFVRADHRAGGLGRLLAQARYMLMAAAPERFAPRVISELRGVSTQQGVSPFWDHVGRHFFKMDFLEADQMSATTDNQFILDLMPKYPIYVDLLAEEARAAIGKCHPEGEAARALLAREGFAYDRVIDIFDGGPLVTAPRDQIRTIRQARRLAVRAGAPRGKAPALIANPNIAAFACVNAVADIEGDRVLAAPSALERLWLADGEEALVWSDAG
jgi:arginine N-succinyltransferase